MNPASFWQRFAAWLIDGVVLTILIWLAGFLITLLLEVATQATGDLTDPAALIFSLLSLTVLLLLQFFYFGYLWSQKAQSIGMGLLNIKVVKADGSRMSFATAGLRGTVGYWISGLVFGLGYLWAAFDPQHQAWHDKLFGTAVLKTRA